MKVNHAGEHGAVNIYAGQIAVCRLLHRKLVPQLTDFKEHEECHRRIFAAELSRRGQLRCRSYHLCGIGGYALGIISGLLGPAAIAATTVAVEQVVLRHLEEQIAMLSGSDEAAVAAIRAIHADEQDHHDASLSHLQPRSFWTRVLRPIVSASTEAVIWVGMRA